MPLSPSPDGPPDAAAAPTFEAAYGELQRAVAQLEGSNVDLEQAIALLERGNELVAMCERVVAHAEQRVTRLAAESATPLSEAAPEQASPTPYF